MLYHNINSTQNLLYRYLKMLVMELVGLVKHIVLVNIWQVAHLEYDNLSEEEND